MKAPSKFFLTGCASGIGQHLSDRLVAQGANLFATDINIDLLTQHADQQKWPAERVRLRWLDVRDPDEWQRAMAEAVAAFGEIDVVVNIAGYMLAGWAHEASRESVDRHFDINVKGVIYGTQVAARQMVKQRQGQGHGHIINIASISALAPIPGLALYSSSKYAVRAYTLAAAQELRPYNVYATSISPDTVRTPMLAPQKEIEAAALLFSSPRFFTVEQIADVILNRAIPHRPMEIILPAHRGWLAHLTNVFPQLAFLFGPFFRKRGAGRQNQYSIDQT